MKKFPSESVQPYFGHVPQTLGQCVASAPAWEQVYSALLFKTDLHLKGTMLPPVVSSRSSNGESLQRDILGKVASDSTSIVILFLLRRRLLVVETPFSDLDATTSAALVACRKWPGSICWAAMRTLVAMQVTAVERIDAIFILLILR